MSVVRSGLRPQGSSRSHAVDFWRGLVLCAIFINHVPGTLFEALTQKNFGFSDSAEAFVFLCGLSLSLAYAGRMVVGRITVVVSALARRAVTLYGVHLLLTVAAIGIFAVGALLIGSDELMEVHGRDLFVDDPWAALIGLASLGHQIGYFNILPLYVVLLAFAAPLLWIGDRNPHVMVGASFVVYLAARYWNWNVPTWPMNGAWFFDPFTWQFVMAIGVYAGMHVQKASLPRSMPLVVLCSTILAAAAFTVTDGLWLLPGLRAWIEGWADLGKTTVGLGRVVHFGALAYLLHVFHIASRLQAWFVYPILCRIGRHSLAMFAVLSVLAAVGQVMTDAFGHSLGLDCGMIGGGLFALAALARHLETKRTIPGSQRIA